MDISPGLRLLSAVLLAATTLLVVPATGAGAVSTGSTSRVQARVDTDGDGLDDAGDGCPTVASGNPTGCPSAWRKVSLTWLKGERRLQAQVSSPVPACSSRARVKLWLDRPGGSDKLLSSDASFDGRRRFKVAGGARYYVTVSPSYVSGVAECGPASSRSVRVPG